MQRHHLEPNVISYNAMISACLDDRCDEALELFDEMQRRDKEPNVVTFTALIGACEAAGRFDDASAALSKGLSCFPSVHATRNSLDLRELSAPVARTAVRLALGGDAPDDFYGPRGEFYVITGTGRTGPSSSKVTSGDAAVLRPAIVALFRDEYTGVFHCAQDPKNAGRLAIRPIRVHPGSARFDYED